MKVGSIAALIVFATLCQHSLAHADEVEPAVEQEVEQDINWGIASEFGRGIGFGIERELNLVFDNATFVAGVGITGAYGESFRTGEPTQRKYLVIPGVVVGYRKYFGGWFIGPSIGANITAAASNDSQTGTVYLNAMLDVGHRWSIGKSWNIRVGLSGGYERSKGDTAELFALTLSVGR